MSVHRPAASRAAALAVVVALAGGAAAEPPRRPTARRRALAVGASLVPGLALHGSGVYVLGDRRTARRLATLEGVGVAAFLAGVLPLFLTYGSPKVVHTSVPLILGGGGLFGMTWLADVYGAAGGPRITGRAGPRPPYELEAGAQHAYDPLFGHRSFLTLGANLELGRIRLAPSAELGVGVDHHHGRIDVGWRLVGGKRRAGRSDRTRLEIVGSVAGRRFGEEGFYTAQSTAMLAGRLDLARIGATLDGAYAELALGYGLEATHYGPGATDVEELPLGRYAMGVYLGDGRGEAELFYDHRRDDVAGGLVLAGEGQLSRPNGYFGHLGAAVRLAVVGRFGIHLETRLGSAWVNSLALVYQGAEP